MKRTHDRSPGKLAHRAAFTVFSDAGDCAVGEMDHPVGRFGDNCIMGDDDGKGTKFPVHPCDGLKDHDPGLDVQGAGGFVAEEYPWTFGNGAGYGHPLLLTARELGRKVVHAIAQFDQGECVFRCHGVGGDVRDQGNVFTGGEARDQVVELENEPHCIAAVAGQGSVVRVGEVGGAKEKGATGHPVESAEDIEQGGFSAARSSEQYHKFALEEIQINPVEGPYLDIFARPVDLGDPPCAKEPVAICRKLGKRLAWGRDIGHGHIRCW